MTSFADRTSSIKIANYAAAVVIMMAGVLSVVWAFMVPIFQAPDEPAHFDYAISIFSAGRLIRVSDGPTAWIVSPYTRYLMRVSDFERIERKSSMHVKGDYGSRAYFARVDAGAPRLMPPIPPSHQINYIVPAYPFGFYALEGAWMKIIAVFTHSLVTMFFAARLLCVALTVLGLYFNYRTTLNLGLPPWIGVALTAAVGFFPLTSFVSSYIQPDNLAYMLVSASLFFATKLRVGLPQLPTVAALGVSIGLLSVTKYQFFISVAFPVVALVAVRLWRAKIINAYAGFLILALLVPSALLLALQHWAVSMPPAVFSKSMPSDVNLAYVSNVWSAGLSAGAAYTFQVARGALVDCFIIGPCAATYWQVVGWFDTPIVIVNSQMAGASRTVISFMSGAVIVVLIFKSGGVALRIARLIARRHFARAAEILTRNPVFGSYACFLAIMFALYVATDNAFTAEGRHFYPYVFAGFLCLVWYAPRSFGRHARPQVVTLSCCLLVYVFVAAAYALIDVRDRYYGSESARYVPTVVLHSRVTTRPATGVLLPVETVDYDVIGRDIPFSFPVGSRLQISGAAIFPEERVAASTVAVVIDSHLLVPVLARQYVLFVGELTRSVSYGYSGFHANIMTSKLDEGTHLISAYAQTPDGNHYDRVAPDRVFFLTGKGGRLSTDFLRRLDKVPTAPGGIQAMTLCKGPTEFFQNVAMDKTSRILVSGLDGTRFRPIPQSVVWLLVDGRPYPAVYGNPDDPAHERAGLSLGVGRRFFGAIPAAAMSVPGIHQVSSYVLRGPSGHYIRIGKPASFAMLGASGVPARARESSACADPLRQLAGG